jgi:2-oxoglutarate dehydrogenase E1 component
VLLCTGKIAYDLVERAKAEHQEDVTILVLEQLYPFPADDLSPLLSEHAGAELVWVQEEPQNMGAWTFVRDRLERPLTYVGPPRSGSPAPGSNRRHVDAQRRIVQQALGLPSAVR